MTAKVSRQSDKRCHVSGVQSIDIVIKTQEAQQLLGNKLQYHTSDVSNAFSLTSPLNLLKLCTVFSNKGQLGNSNVTEVCSNTEFLVGSHDCLISSELLPLHELLISKFGVDDVPFTLQEKPVFRQIVCNGNVQFCPDTAILIEPVSSEAICWFLPGDQLIAINDVIIESKDEAWQEVAECKWERLKLSVRPLAELSELSVRYLHYHGDKFPRKVSYQNSSQQHNRHVSV